MNECSLFILFTVMSFQPRLKSCYNRTRKFANANFTERDDAMHHRGFYNPEHMMGPMWNNSFLIILTLLMIAICVLLIIGFVKMNQLKKQLDRHEKRKEPSYNEAIQLLQRRLVSGEIDEEEYRKLYDVLTNTRN